MSGGEQTAGARAGFAMVMVIMVVTVLNIMLAAALPMWSEMIKRDKEEELISRGFQYAEAIRVFQKRFQRFPVTLEELIKVKPRCIRQLWTDPMTQDGKWAIIYAGQGSPLAPVPGLPNPRRPGADQQQPPFGDASNPPPNNGLDPNGQQVAAAGPIVGVHSRSTEKSLLTFFGQDEYDQWQFRVEMLTGGVRQFGGAGVPMPGMGSNLSTRWLGRPMPNFVPVGNGLPPGGGGPGGPPGPGRRPGGAGGVRSPG